MSFMRFVGVSCAACCVAVSGQEQGARTARVLESEALIEGVRAPLAVLSEGAMNLALPDHHAASVFMADVVVSDLDGSTTDATTEEMRQLDVQAVRWSTERARRLDRSALSLWEELFEEVQFFHYASFYSVRGEFIDADHTAYRAESGFKGLAQDNEGKLLHIKGELDIVWKGSSDTPPEQWRIAELHTKSLFTKSTSRPLFGDVLERAVSPDDYGRAVRSMRDEGLAAWVMSIQSGELPMEEALQQVDDALVAGDFPFMQSHVCVVDIDADGFDDFLVCPYESKPMFFRNKGDGTFEEIAERLGLAHDGVHGATFVDLDNDGDQDALLSFYPEPVRFLRNDDGRFVDKSDLFEDPLPTLVLAISPADYDNDGLIDLYFSRYNGLGIGGMAARMESARARGEAVKPSFPYVDDDEAAVIYGILFSEASDPVLYTPGPPNVLFRNIGDGRCARAENVAAVEQYLQTLAATWSDIDQDGDLDLYVVNEAGTNQLIRNEGNGEFTDISTDETSDPGFGMGLGFGDYDNDGWQDFYVTNMYSKAGLRIADQLEANERVVRSAKGNSLFKNGPTGFKRVSGAGPSDVHVEKADFGWGGAFADFDNDGFLDLYAPAGYITMPREVASVGES